MLPEFVKIQNAEHPDRPSRKVFIVERKAAEHSAILRQLFVHYEEKGGADLSKDVIPINIDISDDSLGKILAWAAEHKDLRKAEDDDAVVTDRALFTFTDWEKKLCDELDELGLYEIIIATNYLDIKRLHEFGLKMVADMLVGKSAPEIREILNFKCDFTPEELENIAKENLWDFKSDEAETSESDEAEATTAEATMAETTTAKAVEATAETTTAGAIVAEATTAETTIVGAIVVEATTVEATTAEATTAEATTAETTTVEATAVETILVEATTAEATTAETTTAKATTAGATTVEASRIESTIADTTTAETTTAKATTAEASTAETTTAETTTAEATTAETTTA